MDHKYMYKLAKLYSEADAESEESRQKIEKAETQAVSRYITDISNAVGITHGMDDLPIVIAAMKAQSDFLMRTLDDDRKEYVEHLASLMKNMKVCSIEIDVGELIKQIHQKENNTETDNDSNTDTKQDKPEDKGKDNDKNGEEIN